MKKILALVIASLLVLSMVAAFADKVDASATYKTTVTVTGVAEGNTVTLYKLVQFNYDSATNDYDYTLATGLGYTYDQLAALTPDGYTLQANTETIRQAADAIAAGIQASPATITPIGNSVSQAAGASGAVFQNLGAGYYLGVVSGTASTEDIYHNMLINVLPVVDSANNTFKAHDAVTLAAKKTTDTITKTVTDVADAKSTDGYSVGDYVPYHITTAIPNYPLDSIYATFEIVDTPSDLTDDISYDEVTVTVGGQTVDHADDAWTIAREGTDGFKITFAKSYILAHPGAAVTVAYRAQIKTTAVITDEGLTAENTAKIIFNPNANINTTVEPSDHTTVYTYGVDVFKYDETIGASEGGKLTGAKFILYKEDGRTVAGEEKEVDSNGYVSWEGLGAGTYKLVETKAPAGFKLDSNPRTITLSAATASDDNRATAATSESYFHQTDVPNAPGSSLPSTGGIGTTIFYVAGSIMVLAAVIFLVTKRRMNANND